MTSLNSRTLEHACAVDGVLHFDTPGGLTKALEDGLFRLSVPDLLDLRPGTTFSQEFYRHPVGDRLDPYRGFRRCRDIYFDREHFQTEHVLADREARARHLPDEVQDLVERMNELALIVLRQSLDNLGIDKRLWYTVTGGAVDNHGTHWFAANHYRSERHQMGCAPHKDTGFVTVLYIEDSGLEAAVGDSWVPIEPSPGDFLINFGGAFELLTESLPRPVRAVLHRVRRSTPNQGEGERFSFAAFVNPPPSGDLYRMCDAGNADPVETVEQFLRTFNAETWNDRHADFGIKVNANQDPR